MRGILTAKENLALKNSDDNGADHAWRDLEALLNLQGHCLSQKPDSVLFRPGVEGLATKSSGHLGFFAAGRS